MEFVLCDGCNYLKLFIIKGPLLLFPRTTCLVSVLIFSTFGQVTAVTGLFAIGFITA